MWLRKTEIIYDVASSKYRVKWWKLELQEITNETEKTIGRLSQMQIEVLPFKGKLKISSSETGREWRNKMDFKEIIVMEVKNWFSSNHP